MQDFWATATVHHHSIHFKMNNKKYIVNLEYFREMLQICPKLLNQQFEELPFEEAILTFLRDLGHNGEIKVITDVNVNKLHQPWISFATVINKCLSGKSTSYDSLRLSQAQILWVMYHKKNVDYVYLLWEDFVYQVENNNIKRSNEMYCPHFTKVVSRHEETQLYGTILPDELMNKAIKDSESYKEYYAIASGDELPKTKASAKKKQPTKTSKAKGADEGTGSKPGVPDVLTYGSNDEQISWKSSDEEDDDEVGMNDDDDDNDDDADNQDDDDNDDNDDDDDGQDDDNQDDDNKQTDLDNDGDDFVHPKFSTHVEEDIQEEGSDLRVHTPSHYESTDEEIQGIDSIFNLNTESTSLVDVLVTTIVEPPLLSTIILPLPPTPLITHLQQIPVPTPATVPSSSLQDLPNFGSLFGLRDEAQAENADFINKLDDNIKKIIKDQVKEQVKAQVSKILPKIEKTINEQLEVEVLTRSSNESKTSHALAANLSKLELKKILIDKMESNKSIHRSNEQKNFYKALVDAYKSDKLILDTYGDTVLFKSHRDDEDKDKEPSAGSNRGSKRRRAGKELESTSAPKEKTFKTTGKSTEGSKSHHKSADESAQAEELMHTTKYLEELAHQEFETGVTDDQPNEETSRLPNWFQKPAKPPTPVRD
ncbi:integrase, catalytic region, zinc finger, CCHC-type containing protein [Tanacetum coccineum]